MTSSSPTDQAVSLSSLWIAAGLSLLFVLFLWNFAVRAEDALGINMTIWLFGCGFFFLWPKKQALNKKEMFFLFTPLALIVLSFFLYENPFLKMTSLVFLPLLFIFIYAYTWFRNPSQQRFSGMFFIQQLQHYITPFVYIGTASRLIISRMLPVSSTRGQMAKRVGIGLGLFILVAFFVILPLLSSADQVFADRLLELQQWFSGFISWEVLQRVFFFLVVFIALIAARFAWAKTSEQETTVVNEKKDLDTIIAGTVLGGVLVCYIVFLLIQLEHLWLNRLPDTFKATESLVKSGFWQLITLSLVNIIFFSIYYHRVKAGVRILLNIFTIASLLLVFSALQRVLLYVSFYGLSYEKFVAAYAVIFCLIVFCWLVVALFSSFKKDIFRFLFFLFVWMYGILTILPMEQVIFRTNLQLSTLPDSRIRLYEMRMLSNDVLPLVKENLPRLLSEQQVLIDGTILSSKWPQWIETQEQRGLAKEWYEKNIQNILYDLSTPQPEVRRSEYKRIPVRIDF